MTQSTSTFHSYQATSYPQLAAELSGDVGDIDKWEEGQSQHAHLIKQSHEIAEKLESVGIEAYDHNQDLVLIGLHSKQFKVVENFRNINFIPCVARKNRTRQSKELSYFLQENTNCRMWTISTGRRCNSSDLICRVKKLHRQISKINSMSFMLEAGASFVFRATEFGEVAPHGDDLSFHPHAHALLYLDRYLPKAEWSKLLAKIQAYFGVHCQDNGRITDPRELVKYCVKPSDLDHLSAEQVALLYNSTKGLRLCEPLRKFRKLRSHIRSEKLKVIQRKGILKMVRSWNQPCPKKSKPELELEQLASLNVSDLAEEPTGSPLVVAWCVPSRMFTPVTEPIMLVQGLGNQAPENVFHWQSVQRMQSLINVHTKMLTVQNQQHIINESKPKLYQKTSPP